MITNNSTQIQENRKLCLLTKFLKQNNQKILKKAKYICFKELDTSKKIKKQDNLFVAVKSDTSQLFLSVCNFVKINRE